MEASRPQTTNRNRLATPPAGRQCSQSLGKKHTFCFLMGVVHTTSNNALITTLPIGKTGVQSANASEASCTLTDVCTNEVVVWPLALGV